MKGKKKIVPSLSKPPTKKLYFGPEVQDSIFVFNQTTDSKIREVIYEKEIFPAFNKLVESLIFIYGFAKSADIIQETKYDCVCFLYENIGKFKPEKGTKAFSYFNVVARNWLIINSKKRMKDGHRHVSIDDVIHLSSNDKKLIAHHSVLQSPEDVIIEAGRKDRILEVLTKIESKLTTEHEKSVIAALRLIFENVESIDLISERAIFLYVKEIANINQKQLSVSMSVIKRHYKEITKGDGDLL